MFRILIWVWLALPFVALAEGKTAYQYFRVGAAADKAATPTAGYALMGGGTDLDEAFRWMCARAGGGDFLVLRAAGTDAYNPYIAGLEDEKSCRLNSVATLIIPSREAAEAPFVAEAIAHAEAVFIAGGDQTNYIQFWTGTPVQREINAAIRRGVPLGGTSAGLAVMGEWVYSAEGDKPDDPNLSGRETLMDPWSKRVTLIRGFLDIPILKGVITDSHFAKRDRMGRLLTFLVRLSEEDGKPLPGAGKIIRGIGIEERVAVLVEPNGHSTVVGPGNAYFVQSNNGGLVLKLGDPLTLSRIAVQKVASGHGFDLRAWGGDSDTYWISVERGELTSSQAGGAVY